MRTQCVLASLTFAALASGCSPEGGSNAAEEPPPDSKSDISTLDTTPEASPDTTVADSGVESAPPDVAEDTAPPTTIDLHKCTLYDNPTDLADWPVTTEITVVEFQYKGGDGIHVEFSKRDGSGSWPDITPPGWDGPLEYTMGIAEFIGGKCYASAGIQFWRGPEASGGNVPQGTGTKAHCPAFR